MARSRQEPPAPQLVGARQPDPEDADWGGGPVQRNPFAQPSDTRVTGISALTSIEQQRQIAEVQSRMVVARSFPRDQRQCYDRILNECTRPALAEKALYSFARGGTEITGPSIRLMEAIARHWGNIAAGIKEISRSGEYSECVAYAWDLETGYYDERQYQIRHWRDVSERRSGGRGGYVLTDERDIYELIANYGQRRKRATLQAVIPGDVVDAAVEQCAETLAKTIDVTPDGIKKMLAAFEEFGVTKEHLEARCQCRIQSIRSAQMVQLRKIYTSLQDGMSSPGDWFEIATSAAANGHDKVGTQQAGDSTASATTQPAQTQSAEGGGEKTAPQSGDSPQPGGAAKPTAAASKEPPSRSAQATALFGDEA